MQLVVIEPGGKQWRMELKGKEYLIGRDSSLAITLDHRRVSRRHARLIWRRGKYYIEDLKSANGVKVDGVAITASTPLDEKSLIDIGGFRLSLQADAPAQGNRGKRTSSWLLVGDGGAAAGRSYPLSLGANGLGRGADNVVAIDDPSISRHHALLTVQQTDLTLKDLHSSNGTFVNDQRIETATVQADDLIRLGKVELRLQSQPSARPTILDERLTKIGPHSSRLFVISMMVGSALLLAAIAAIIIHRHRTEAASERERAYEHRIATTVSQIKNQMKDQHWAPAILNYEELLDMDPINQEGRAGLAAAQLNQEHEKLLNQARQAIQINQPTHALQLLVGISPRAHYGSAGEALADKAREAVIRNMLPNAEQACKHRQWRDCQVRAGLMLVYVHNFEPALAFIAEAENAMRTQHQPFTPWGTGGFNYLLYTYPDNPTRAAVLRYAAGDVDTAILRLRAAGNRRVTRTALDKIEAFRHSKAQAEKLVRRDAVQALQAWDKALNADRELLRTTASVPRSIVQHRMAAEFNRLGAKAAERQLYVDAFTYWTRALQLEPSNQEAAYSLSTLDKRALDILANMPGQHPDSAACAQLRALAATTRSTSTANKMARKRLAECP